MSDPIIPKILTIFAATAVLLIVARAFPNTWWSRLLFSRHGPDLDAVGSSPGHALRSAFYFGCVAATGVGTVFVVWGIGTWLTPGDPTANEYVAVVFFAFSIVTMMGVGGVLYSLARALVGRFRSPDDVPNSVEEDHLERDA